MLFEQLYSIWKLASKQSAFWNSIGDHNVIKISYYLGIKGMHSAQENYDVFSPNCKYRVDKFFNIIKSASMSLWAQFPLPLFSMEYKVCLQHFYRITEKYRLEGTSREHPVQLPTQGWLPSHTVIRLLRIVFS